MSIKNYDWHKLRKAIGRRFGVHYPSDMFNPAIRAQWAAEEERAKKRPRKPCRAEGVHAWHCPRCGRLHYERDDYCDNCGQRIKWR